MPGVDIDEPLVRCLLREQHPDLAELELREVPGGWDNRMWRLGDHLAIRLPLTPRAPYLLGNEQRWLPVLAPRLPLPVPQPLRAGKPSPRFPSTWAIVRWVDGDPADRSPISRPDAARTLAGFLRALHCDAPGDAPFNPSRGIPLQALCGEFEQWHEYVFPPAATGQHDGEQALSASAVRAAWERAVTVPLWPRAPVWIHGDLHPANVTVAHGTLAGVIDFGEMCAGDPAVDLSAAWLLLPAGTASQFFGAYAIADAATIARARGWAVVRAVMLMGIGKNGERGLPGGKKTWGPAGRAGLCRVLADDRASRPR